MLVLLAVVAGVAVSGCRAPGEPPSHPDQGEYQDVIRREIDAAGTALATGVLVLRYIEQGKVPEAYGRVVLRQAANDPRKVDQDLTEITPPTRARSSQRAFRAIAIDQRRRLHDLASHLHDARALRNARAALSRASDELDGEIAEALDPP
jgi:hypothetical protein